MIALRTVALDEKHQIQLGTLPDGLIPDEAGFQALWSLHPTDYHEIKMIGRLVRTPRWQQAYGADYRYTGRVNRALPLTSEMQVWLDWSAETFEPRLNGLLFNWYEGTSGHYIGAHRDSEIQRIVDTPIVTLSFGEARAFRMRPFRGKGFIDVPVRNGEVLIIPWNTNRAFTHEVPAPRAAKGRRISITIRSFSV
jgi:alkylated DNA repair dioxygenase AlkB